MDKTEERRSGKSTRLVDKFIQDLFINGECLVIDHTNLDQMNIDLMYRVLGRLRIEHCIMETDLTVDFGKRKITLNKR